MKIFCLLAALAKGGMERQLIILMEELSRRGYDITLVTFSPRVDAYELPSVIKRVKIVNSSRIFSVLRLCHYLHKAVSEGDVIISFGRIASTVGILSSLFTKRRFILGERNLKPLSRFQKCLYKKADVIVPNSRSQEKYLRGLYSNKPTIHCITNYTDTNHFRPKKELINTEDRKVIGIFARIHPQKNIVRFINAIHLLVSHNVTNFRVEWYGAKQSREGVVDSYYDEVINHITTLGLENYIKICEPVNNVVETINYFDAICLPSLFEGFSNSISEAICCGKIVLASDVSDNSVMVHDSENGFLFNPNQESDIANAIKKFLILSDEKILSMEQYSRKLAVELFNLQSFGDSYESLLK